MNIGRACWLVGWLEIHFFSEKFGECKGTSSISMHFNFLISSLSIKTLGVGESS